MDCRARELLLRLVPKSFACVPRAWRPLSLSVSIRLSHPILIVTDPRKRRYCLFGGDRLVHAALDRLRQTAEGVIRVTAFWAPPSTSRPSLALPGFQLPTNSPPTTAPSGMSVSRDSPRHMTYWRAADRWRGRDNRRAGRSGSDSARVFSVVLLVVVDKTIEHADFSRRSCFPISGKTPILRSLNSRRGSGRPGD